VIGQFYDYYGFQKPSIYRSMCPHCLVTVAVASPSAVTGITIMIWRGIYTVYVSMA